MYAQRSQLQRGSRSASFAAALAVNAALIAGIIYAAPKITPPEQITRLITENVPITPPRPPVEPQPKAEADPRPVQTQVFVPEPVVRPIETPTSVTTTPIEQPYLPPLPSLPMGGSGTGVAADPAPTPAPPPLIPAEIDSRYARDLQPDYPASERRSGNEGIVQVRVLIGTDGRVKQVERVRASSDAFFEVTRRQALSRWRFRPATRGGVPQESWQTKTVRFELDR